MQRHVRGRIGFSCAPFDSSTDYLAISPWAIGQGTEGLASDSPAIVLSTQQESQMDIFCPAG